MTTSAYTDQLPAALALRVGKFHTKRPYTETGALFPGSSSGTAYYKMGGMDHTINGRYDTWLVIGAPDTSGALYMGSMTKPLRKIVVLASWRA